MSGINQAIVLSVCRIKVTFVDPIGNYKDISGTGFQVQSVNDVKNIVTNRHNVDPKLILGNTTKYKLFKLEIELRRSSDKSTYHKETEFFEVDLNSTTINSHASADAAAIVDPVYLNLKSDYKLTCFLKNELANREFFNTKVAIMDIASFIGFPGDSVSKWWDQQWNMGVARVVNIASHPSIPFTHPDIATSDTTLVSGLSFSGSSGSVVLLHEKGIKTGSGLSGGNYIEPKILGIMSGHWQDANALPNMFKHSGLSYFTRSESILSII